MKEDIIKFKKSELDKKCSDLFSCIFENVRKENNFTTFGGYYIWASALIMAGRSYDTSNLSFLFYNLSIAIIFMFYVFEKNKIIEKLDYQSSELVRFLRTESVDN